MKQKKKLLTRRITIDAHRYMWDLMATTLLAKERACKETIKKFGFENSFPRNMTDFGIARPISHCFLCEYSLRQRDKVKPGSPDYCPYCPVSWPQGIQCPENFSLFQYWRRDQTNVRLMTEIRDLPEKPRVWKEE